MGWLYGGYFTAWYLVFGLLFTRFLPTSESPPLLALGCFVLAPLLLLGGTGVVFEVVDDPAQAAMREGMSRRAFSPAYAFVLGLTLAVVAIVVAGGLFAAGSAGGEGPWSYLMLLVPVVTGLTPLLGVRHLQTLCAAGQPPKTA